MFNDRVSKKNELNKFADQIKEKSILAKFGDWGLGPIPNPQSPF